MLLLGMLPVTSGESQAGNENGSFFESFCDLYLGICEPLSAAQSKINSSLCASIIAAAARLKLNRPDTASRKPALILRCLR